MNPLGLARSLWRSAAPDSLRRLAAPALNRVLEGHVRLAARRPRGAGDAAGPIRVVGHFSASHGIAASARLTVRAFEALGVEVEQVDVTDARLDWSGRLTAPVSAGAWIFHMNAPELLPALACLGPRRLVGPRYGYWAWELPRAPRRWLADAALLDEVWAPSRYTADALAGAAAPVRVVPHPLFAADYAEVAPSPRRAAFQVVTLFDFNSSVARKNPQGAIEAFRRAFGDDPGCQLTVKTQNGDRFPELLAALRDQAPANVRIVDEVWPYAEVKRLIAGADVLVSLHRAEGFGLTLAEAMAMGVPVVATGFSGVTDFLDADSGSPISWRPTAVVDPQGIYAGQTWAEPDLDVAAVALAGLRDDPALRARLGQAGRRRVTERLSPAAWFDALPAQVRSAAKRATKI